MSFGIDCTIFSDASLCPHSGAAGWGVWIKSSIGTHEAGGKFKSPPRSIDEAELYAIANAVYRANSIGWFKSTAMLQSDCMTALAIIKFAVPHVKERPHGAGMHIARRYWRDEVPAYAKDAVAILTELVKGKTLLIRHVKAHTRGSGRLWVNNRCDEIAKKHMNEMRKELGWKK